MINLLGELIGDLLHTLKRIEAKLDVVILREMKMSAEIDALTQAVEQETTVDESAIALLNTLSDQISQLKNDPVALQALADSLNNESSKLSQAVTANTPSA